MKWIWLALLVALGIFIFGLISKGEFGPPPGVLTKQSLCPDPLVPQTPIDLNLVTSVYYPGQYRGGNYKPHGAFRFDNAKSNAIEVRAPADSELQDAVRYIEQGVVQYMFDFVHPCGIRYRLDHLLTLSPKFAEMVEGLPEPKVDDSRTTHLDQPVSVKQGEIVATAVGVGKDVFVDFGVYDMRGESAFKDPVKNAVCWFDLLPALDSAKVKALPPATGSQSDLCK